MNPTSVFLMEPFPESRIRQREGAGRKVFDYVNAGDVIDKVIKATENVYGWEVLSSAYYAERTVTRTARDGKEYQKTFPAFWSVHGRLTLQDLGSRDGIGTQVEENEDSLKGAETDALKRAAVKFGVALNLYLKDDEGPTAWAEEFADRCARMGYTGSNTALCKRLVRKEEIKALDYAAAMKLTAAEWNTAIGSVAPMQAPPEGEV